MSDQSFSTFRVRVLLVDDERSLLAPMADFLSKFYSVETADSGGKAIELVEQYNGEFDVALIDESLTPGPSGIEVMKRIRSHYPNIEVIIFTGWGPEQRQNALRSGAFRYLEKPVNKDELVLLIRSAAQQVRLHAINQEMLASRGMDGLQEAIIKAACSLVFADDSAMVFTSPLTGKEIVRKSKAARYAQPCFKRHIHHTNLTRKIMQEGEPVSIPDTEVYPKVDACLLEAGFRSFIGLPIPGELHNQGVLYVYSKTSHHFDELGNTAFLRTIAAQAGLALTNAWAEEQLRLHNRYMEALVRASRELSAAHSLEEMFDIAWRFVQEKLGVSIFYIALFDENTNSLSFPLYYDQSVPYKREPRSLDIRKHWGVTGYVIKTGEEVYWKTLDAEEVFCKEKNITLNILGTRSKSCFFYPLIIDGSASGVISVQSQSENSLPTIYLDALRALGNHLCVALKNLRLKELEILRRSEAEALYRATQTISNSIEPNLVIHQILNTMRMVVPFDYATVQLLRGNEEKKYFELIDGMGFPNLPSLIGKTFPIDARVTYYQVYQEKCTVIISNVSLEFPDRISPQLHTPDDIQSWMGVPLLAGNDMIGLITLNSRELNYYTEHHAKLVEIFASGVAQAINNAQHHEEIEHSKRLLEAVTDAARLIRSEAEPKHLLFETVHQAVALLGFSQGALFYYNPFLQELELSISYNMPESLNDIRFSASLCLAGKAAITGHRESLLGVYRLKYPQDPILAGFDVHSALAVPIKHPNDPETQRVLLLVDQQPHRVNDADLEVLEKLIDQAAIAIRTSILISSEIKRFEQLTIVQKIYEFIQTHHKLEDILHLVLTGITAGYGLGFNRAVFFQVDYANNSLIGKMAIGCVEAEEAQADWSDSRIKGMDNFSDYLDALISKTLISTSLHKLIVGKTFASQGKDVRVYISLLKKHRCLRLEPSDLSDFPDFFHIFKPTGKMVAVSLVVSGEFVGLILVDNKFNMAPITAESESALVNFANLAGLAIENDRLITKLQRTRDAAFDVTKVSKLGNLSQSLGIIRENARSVLACDMFTLYTYDAKLRKFTGLEHYGCLDETHIRSPEQLKPTSSPYKVIGFTEPSYHFTENAQIDSFFSGYFALDEKIRATLAIKLAFQGEPVGALFLNYRSEHVFPEDEINTALLFADQAAIAIKNARLYSQIEQQRNYLQQLYDAGTVVTSSLSLQDILQILTERARQLTGLEGREAHLCNVLLEESGLLRFAASAPKELMLEVTHVDPTAAPCGMTGRAYLTGVSQLAQDVSKNLDYIRFNPDTQSELTVPMKSGGKVIGVINVEDNHLEAFNEVDQSNLELLAAQAAIAIQNARAYDELRKAQGIIGARTALLWTGMSASVWRHSIEKDAITIRDEVGLLRMDLERPVPAKEKMFERCGKLERLAKHILAKPITTPLDSESGLESVLVNSLIKERVMQLWERPDYPPVTYELDFGLSNDVSVWASPEWLRRAFDVLVENAVREVRPLDVKQVKIGTRLKNKDQLEIYISDTGRGVPTDIWNKLGEEFIPRSPNSDTMGVGLMIANIIVGTYGGSLVKINTSSSGTEIGLCLPIYRSM